MDWLYALTIIAPIFICIGLGYLFKRIHFVDDTFIKGLNRFSFRFMIPLVVFYNIYRADFSNFDANLLWFILIALPVVLLILVFIVHFTVKDRSKKGAIMQGFIRMNQALFAMPLMESMYGTASAGVAAVLCSAAIPITNIITVVLLSYYQEGEKVSIKKLFISVISNPFLIATFLGLGVMASGWKFPDMIEDIIGTLSGAATPLALIALGADIKFSKDEFSGNVGGIIYASVLRLVVIPVIILGAAVAFGFRGMDLGGLLFIVSAPTAVSSYQMAVEMKADARLARQIVVFTTIFSLLTIFLLVTFFHGYGLI